MPKIKDTHAGREHWTGKHHMQGTPLTNAQKYCKRTQKCDASCPLNYAEKLAIGSLPIALQSEQAHLLQPPNNQHRWRMLVSRQMVPHSLHVHMSPTLKTLPDNHGSNGEVLLVVAPGEAEALG
jgi:hypothetical protein